MSLYLSGSRLNCQYNFVKETKNIPITIRFVCYTLKNKQIDLLTVILYVYNQFIVVMERFDCWPVFSFGLLLLIKLHILDFKHESVHIF